MEDRRGAAILEQLLLGESEQLYFLAALEERPGRLSDVPLTICDHENDVAAAVSCEHPRSLQQGLRRTSSDTSAPPHDPGWRLGQDASNAILWDLVPWIQEAFRRKLEPDAELFRGWITNKDKAKAQCTVPPL